MSNSNDGAIPYASRHLDFYPQTTPGSSGTSSSYSGAVKKFTGVMENIRVSRPAYDVNRYDESRNPNGSMGIDDFVTGSGTVQLPFDPKQLGNPESLLPGDAFNTIYDQQIGAEQFVITGVDSPESQGSYKTQEIRFKKLYKVNNVPATTPN